MGVQTREGAQRAPGEYSSVPLSAVNPVSSETRSAASLRPLLSFSCFPNMLFPVPWRYWSLPRHVGRRRTLGDLYTSGWGQGGLCRDVFSWPGFVPAALLCACLFALHGRDSACVLLGMCHVCSSAFHQLTHVHLSFRYQLFLLTF